MKTTNDPQPKPGVVVKCLARSQFASNGWRIN